MYPTLTGSPVLRTPATGGRTPANGAAPEPCRACPPGRVSRAPRLDFVHGALTKTRAASAAPITWVFWPTRIVSGPSKGSRLDHCTAAPGRKTKRRQVAKPARVLVLTPRDLGPIAYGGDRQRSGTLGPPACRCAVGMGRRRGIHRGLADRGGHAVDTSSAGGGVLQPLRFLLHLVPGVASALTR